MNTNEVVNDYFVARYNSDGRIIVSHDGAKVGSEHIDEYLNISLDEVLELVHAVFDLKVVIAANRV